MDDDEGDGGDAFPDNGDRVLAAPGVVDLYRRLRERILDGSLPPGSEIPQLTFAPALNVSRSKLREALRMLESEGLIESPQFRRSRVREVDPRELEAIYVSRITLESVGLAVTVPEMGAAELRQLNQDLAIMDEVSGTGDPRFELHHRRFHMAFVQGAPAPMLATIERTYQHSERYRRLLMLDAGASVNQAVGQHEHRELADAARARDLHCAVAVLAPHYLRTVEVVSAIMSPGYTPRAARMACALVTAPAADAPPLGAGSPPSSP